MDKGKDYYDWDKPTASQNFSGHDPRPLCRIATADNTKTTGTKVQNTSIRLHYNETYVDIV